MKDVIITYIGGGSKAWAKKFMSDLLIQNDVNGTLRLYDIDVEAAERNKKYFDRLKADNEVGSKWDCEVYEGIDEALKGTKFVVISILPGTFDEMEVDVHLPEKYGILQSVGDTTGPGGYNRALRTIPIYQGFAQKIREICPGAWVINYTNPMTLCIATLYKEFPEIKAFGCCHEVFTTQMLLKDVYEQATGEKVTNHKDIKVNVQGINHFTWLNEAHYKDVDLMPLYKEFIEKHHEKGYMIEKHKNDAGTDRVHFSSRDMVKMDLFRRLGVIAAAGDRHLAEFLPNSYLNTLDRIEEMSYYLTKVSWRKFDAQRKVDETVKLLSNNEHVNIEPSDEEGVDQIRALLGFNTLVTNVNLPNYGQQPDLPLGAIVETNAVFNGNSVKPVFAGKINAHVKPYVLEHSLNQENFVNAYFSKDKQALFEAFYNDPAVNKLSRKDALNLFNELIDGTKEYVEDWVVKDNIV